MLPDWLDADRLQWILLIALAVVVYAMYLVTRFVQRMIMRFLLFVLLAGVGLSLWVQRADLQECVDTCACSLYGQEVEIPAERRLERCGADAAAEDG